MKHTFPHLTLLALISPWALAAQNELLNESDFFVDIPEVTSATRLPQKLSDAPASMTVIDRQMIDAAGLQTLPDIMRLVPGFQSYMVGANRTSTSYHGASDDWPNRIEVMVDGRSVYLPLLSTVDWNTLAIGLEDVERIEVVRGSNVPTQGSNAFFGSINIITREPAAEHGTRVTATLGASDTRNGHIAYADVAGSLSYRIGINHRENDGNRHWNNLFADEPEYWNDSLSSSALNLRATYTPNLIDTWTFAAGYESGDSVIGQLDKTDQPYGERSHSGHYQSVDFSRLLSDTGTLRVKAYHNYLDLNSPLATLKLGHLLLDGLGLTDELVAQTIDLSRYRPLGEHGSMHTYDTEIQASDRGAYVDWVAGVGYRHETASSDNLLQQGEAEEDRLRLFTNLNIKPAPRWSVNSGVMFEHSSNNIDAFSYRQTLGYQPRPGTSLRLGYSASERLPSLLEQKAYTNVYLPAIPGLTNETTLIDVIDRPNPDLDVETIRTLELGLYQSFDHHQGHVDVRIFREEVDDGIIAYRRALVGSDLGDYALTIPGIDTYVQSNRNLANWTNTGAELQIQHRPTPGVWYALSYSYINTVNAHWDRGISKSAFTANPSMTPEHTLSLLTSWSPSSDIKLSAAHYYMDEVDWDEGGERDAYNRTDLKAAMNWQLDSRHQLETAIIVQNAFDRLYSEFYRLNEFDRRTFLQLRLLRD
ncbi:MAG: hypothetical protein CMI01_15035 [Oceanospirillaceae bacterium]|nr:hypothetical protein [Oceanospirillaceae bacterium]